MDSRKGVFIVLEGSDGSGKATQFSLLRERLKAMGYDTEVFDFPRYEEPSSYFVRQYLNGAYGPASQISPYTASLFYALDRYEAAPAIKDALEAGKIVLANRYVGSNMAHQGSKFHDAAEQRGFFVWEDGLEFSLLGIPRPDINIFLKVPAEISFELIGRKNARNYTDKSHDEHEADIGHLKRSVATFSLLSQLFPKDFKTVECTQNGQLMSIPDINNRIFEVVRPLLPLAPQNGGKEAVVHLDNLSGPAGTKASGVKKAAVDTSELPAEQKDNLELKLEDISLLALDSLLAYPGISLTSKTEGRGHYRLPKLDKKLAADYNSTLNELEQLRKQMKKQPVADSLKRKGLQAALEMTAPMAQLQDVTLSGSAESISGLVNRLATHENQELKWVGQQLKLKADLKLPSTGKTKPPQKAVPAVNDFMTLFMQGSISKRDSETVEPIKLLSASPRNEFDVLADSIYAKSTLPRDEIMLEIETWPYEQKLQALRAVLANDDVAAGQVSYRWDIVADKRSMHHLVLIAKDISVQTPTTKYGYDIPAEVEGSRIEELAVECFSLSNALHDLLKQSSREDLAGYAALAGHKRRWLFTTSLSSLRHQLADQAGESQLLEQMLEQIGLLHPIITDEALAGSVPEKISSHSQKQPARSRQQRAKKRP